MLIFWGSDGFVEQKVGVKLLALFVNYSRFLSELISIFVRSFYFSRDIQKIS